MVDYTREQPKEVSLPPRLPLFGVIDERPGELDRDAKLVNGYLERTELGELHVVKRPGLELRYAFGSNRLGAGLFGDKFFFQAAVEGGRTFYFYQEETLISATIGQEAIPVAEGTLIYFTETVAGSSVGAVFHTQRKMYAYDITLAGVLEIPLADTTLGPFNFALNSGSNLITTSPERLLPTYSGVIGSGIPTPTSIVSRLILPGTPPLVEQYTLTQNATATSSSTSLTINAAGPNGRSLFSGASTAILAPGIVDLNASVFVLNTLAEITNSDRGNVFNWNPLSLIRAYLYESPTRYITRQLGYVIVFKETVVEVFRDAGLSPGSPLARQEGMTLEVGLSNSNTIAEKDGVMFWCSLANSGRRSAWMMTGGRAREIASPAVSRVLTRSNPDNGHAFSVSGHLFYALSDPAEPYTLVYDLSTGFWSYWEALDEGYWPFVAATRLGEETLLQHRTNGNIYQLRDDVFADDHLEFTMDIYPPEFDSGVKVHKFLPRMYIVGDQQDGSVLEMRFNDNNRQEDSWSDWYEARLDEGRPRIDDLGSFVKRAFHFRHTRPLPCRLQAFELDMSLGMS